jgi:hypothetical protein
MIYITRIHSHEAERIDRAWDVLMAELTRLEGRRDAAPEPAQEAAEVAA